MNQSRRPRSTRAQLASEISGATVRLSDAGNSYRSIAAPRPAPLPGIRDIAGSAPPAATAGWSQCGQAHGAQNYRPARSGELAGRPELRERWGILNTRLGCLKKPT